MTLLQKRDFARRQRRLAVYAETRRQLKDALAELIPGHEVIVFGSLTKPGVFNDHSDVDLAFHHQPNAAGLTEMLMQRLRRPVDLVVLSKCQFRDKILREGESWIA